MSAGSSAGEGGERVAVGSSRESYPTAEGSRSERTAHSKGTSTEE